MEVRVVDEGCAGWLGGDKVKTVLMSVSVLRLLCVPTVKWRSSAVSD